MIKYKTFNQRYQDGRGNERAGQGMFIVVIYLLKYNLIFHVTWLYSYMHFNFTWYLPPHALNYKQWIYYIYTVSYDIICIVIVFSYIVVIVIITITLFVLFVSSRFTYKNQTHLSTCHNSNHWSDIDISHITHNVFNHIVNHHIQS